MQTRLPPSNAKMLFLYILRILPIGVSTHNLSVANARFIMINTLFGRLSLSKTFKTKGSFLLSLFGRRQLTCSTLDERQFNFVAIL